MKPPLKKTNKVIELCFFIIIATVIFAFLWLRPRHFSNIREIAAMENGGFVVFDETGNDYIFWTFDSENRLTDKIEEAKKMQLSGPETEYSGMALFNGKIYLQKRIYSDDGVLIHESIVSKTTKETIDIFDIHHSAESGQYLTGGLIALEDKLFFLTQNSSMLTLWQFDEHEGVSELAAITPENFSWNSKTAYIGDGNVVIADENSEITIININSSEIASARQAGAVQSIAAQKGSYAYFDLFDEAVVLKLPGENIIKFYTGRLLSHKLCLQNDNIIVIETDNQRYGKSIITLNMKNEWNPLILNWFTAAGALEALSYTLIILICLAAARIWLYLLFEQYMPVTYRVVVIIVPLTICFLLVFYYISYLQVYRHSVSVQEKALEAAVQKDDKVGNIKQAILECGIDTPANSEFMLFLEKEMFELSGMNRNAAPHRTLMYYGIILVKDGEYYSFCFGFTKTNYQKKANLKYLYKDTAIKTLKLAAKEKTEGYFTTQGDTAYYFYQTPVIDEYGQVMAVLEAGIDLNMIEINSKTVARRQSAAIILFSAVLTAVFTGVLRIVMRRLKTLKAGVERITFGEIGVNIPVDSKDELSDIAEAFNIMSAYVDQKTRDNSSFEKFVPEEIAFLFGKEAFAPGDSASLRFFVLNLDLRRFHNESDSEVVIQSCNDIAKTIGHKNGYMRHMDANKGFCLFHKPDTALESALDIGRKYREYSPFAAVDYDNVTVAVLGNQKHYHTATFSKAMERTNAILNNASALGANIVLTQEAFCALSEPDKYRYRYLGIVSIDGFLMKLYDFYGSDVEAQLHMKSEGLEHFNTGVALFYDGQRKYARDKFVQCLKIFPGDSISRKYLTLCEEEGVNCLTIDTKKS